MVVNPGGGDIGVAKPFLHLGNVGLVVERVGGRCRPQRMRADLSEAELDGISAHHLIDKVPGVIALSSSPVVRLRIGRNSAPLFVLSVAGCNEIFVNERMGAGMQRQISPSYRLCPAR